MRTWEYVIEQAGEDCGYCGERQPVGTPVLVTVLEQLPQGHPKRRRIRCQADAGEPVNHEQLAQFFPPVVVTPAKLESGFSAFDPKALQLPTRDRE